MSQTAEIPFGYCHCGCGGLAPIADRNSARKGWVKGQPKRYILHHRWAGPNIGPEYLVDAATGCWVWQRAVSGDGYGIRTISKKRHLAHRLSYAKHVGPIPEGYDIHHKCENKPCVNPDHLEALERRAHRSVTHGYSLTQGTADIIRARCEELAAEFGTSMMAISAIARGLTWSKQ